MTDAELAADLAEQAGRMLLDLRASQDSGDPRAIGRAADHAANIVLSDALRVARPYDGLLSEETECDGARLDKSRVWIIDPVDGTREFGEGRDDWAVHVGLSIDGVPAVGAVALPVLGLVLRSDRPTPIPAHPARPRMVVSRTRPPAQALRVADALDAELIPMGSAGAKAMAVVRGVADIYLHAGGQHQWDNCAPAAVALSHGLHASRIDGAPLVYNRKDSSIPDLVICRPNLAPAIFTALRVSG